MIAEVGLRHFKCFDAKTINLKGLTVLAGINGSGKSSTLQSLLLLRQSFLSGALSNGRLQLNGELITLGTPRDVFYQQASDELFELRVKETSRKAVHRWRFRFNPKANSLDRLRSPRLSAIREIALFGDEVCYLEAERFGPRTSSAVPTGTAKNDRDLGTKGQFTAYVLAAHGTDELQNRALLHPTESRPAIIRQVEAWLGEISPGARLDATPHLKMDLVQLQYSYPAGRTMNTELRPTNVGFGLSYALPVIVAALAAKSNSILLIENPEAHLHPRGQEKLGMLLALAASGDVQVVVETHSDHFVNGVRLAVKAGLLEPKRVGIRFFSRDELEGTSTVDSLSIDEQGRIDRWPEGFFDQFMRASLELLRP
jgi:predicted ATPase